MSAPLQGLLGGCAIVITVASVWGAFGLNKHAIETLDAWKQSAPDLKPTLEEINRPCGGGTPCGTLATINKTIVKAGDAVVTTQFAERTAAPHVVAAMDSIASIAPHVNPAIDTAKGTLAAGTELTQQATATLRTINLKAGPMIDAYTGAGIDLDALLKSHAVNETLENVQFTTQNVAGITADFGRVTHKAANDYLTPKPLWKKIGVYAGDAFDYGAFIARHY